MPRFKKEKDPFKLLPAEFKDAVVGMDVVEIRKQVAKIALDQAQLFIAEKADQDLADKKEIAKEAAAVYKEGGKMNRLKISYCRSILENKGNL